MPSNNLPLLILQQQIADRLDGDAWFDKIPIVTENLGDVPSIVNIAVGKLGSVVVVETPLANNRHPNTPSIDFDVIPIVVTVWENVILNRNQADPSASLKQALDTAQVIAALIHGYQVGGYNSFFTRNPTIVKANDLKLNGYHVNFQISAGLRYESQASLVDNDSRSILTNAGATLLPN